MPSNPVANAVGTLIRNVLKSVNWCGPFKSRSETPVGTIKKVTERFTP